MKKISFGVVTLAFVTLLGAGCSTQTETKIDETQDITPQTSDTETQNPEITNTTMQASTFEGVLPNEEIVGKQIHITTSKGDIVFKLFPDTAPLAVSNMVSLASKGFYDGLTFHRRVEGFVIQGGDPLGSGSGGPGYKFADELSDSRTYTRGIVAMANSGANTNGSQFFIMLADYALPKNYTIFGEVTAGMDVVDDIAVGDVMTKVVVEGAE